MKAMQIRGLGLVGGFGCGKQELRRALAEGSSPVSSEAIRGERFHLFKADTAPLQQYINKRALRRIDHFSKLALLGAFQAMEDAGRMEMPRERLGVVVASGYGAIGTTFNFLDSLIEAGDACASPTAFSNSVHNAAAAHISMQLKSTGPSLTVSQFDQSCVSGLLAAQQWLDEGRVDAVLFGVVDEFCSVLGYCWQRFMRNREGGVMDPLDFGRMTAMAGEGAAFFLLDSGEEAAPYGHIDRVAMGQLCGSRPALENAGPLILSCEGHPTSGDYYRQQLTAEQSAVCYTPLYGASPVSQGFDLAVAALAIEQGELFPSVAAAGSGFPARLLTQAQACRELTCLRYGFAGEYASISLSGA